jgi:hypothetical protein
VLAVLLLLLVPVLQRTIPCCCSRVVVEALHTILKFLWGLVIHFQQPAGHMVNIIHVVMR